MIPKRSRSAEPPSKGPSLRLVEPRGESVESANARRLVADMAFSALCDIMHHDGPGMDGVVNYELRKLASEMLGRSGRPFSDFPRPRP